MIQDNYRNRKYVIFGGDGINPLGVIRSLGQEGIKTDVIRLRDSAHLASVDTSVYTGKSYLVETSDDVLRTLLDHYGNEKQKTVLFFTDEGHSEICDNLYDQLKDKFIFYNAGKNGGVNHLNDKEVQCQLAQACGIRTPKYEVLKVGQLPTQVPYPVITKTLTSTEGRWKKDMIICHNEEELKTAYQEIEAERIMVEEYFDAPNEFDLNGFSINGGEQIYFTYQKRWKFKDSERRWHMIFEPCTNEDIKCKLSKLIKEANYSGIFDAEFLQLENNELVFLEVNWRTGMFNYNHTAAGVNLPFLWTKSTIDRKIDFDNIKPTMQMYIAMDEMSFADVLRNPKYLFTWFKALRKADMLFYYHPVDKRPYRIAWKHFWKRKISNVIAKVAKKLPF